MIPFALLAPNLLDSFFNCEKRIPCTEEVEKQLKRLTSIKSSKCNSSDKLYHGIYNIPRTIQLFIDSFKERNSCFVSTKFLNFGAFYFGEFDHEKVEDEFILIGKGEIVHLLAKLNDFSQDFEIFIRKNNQNQILDKMKISTFLEDLEYKYSIYHFKIHYLQYPYPFYSKGILKSIYLYKENLEKKIELDYDKSYSNICIALKRNEDLQQIMNLNDYKLNFNGRIIEGSENVVFFIPQKLWIKDDKNVIKMITNNEIDVIFQFLSLEQGYSIDVIKKEVEKRNSDRVEQDNILNHSNDNIQVGSEVISLLDEICKTRIVTPAKGDHCDHLQCFDLEIYLKYAMKHNDWYCPICEKPLPIFWLYVDKKMLQILNSIKEDKVKFLSDGTWESVKN